MLKHFDEIKNFLPHREPFLFIEEIVEVELGKRIHCILKKNNINILYLLQILLHIDTKMKISFTDKILESDHPVFIVSNKASKIDSSISSVDRELINILKEFLILK